MKKELMVVALMLTGVSLVGAPVKAQGPAGAGAGAATADSQHSSHSLNPIKWVRKSPKSASDQLDAKSEADKKLTDALQAQGVLPAGKDVKSACDTFKSLEDCVAALHASHNLGLDFNCVKSDLTGVPTSADMSSCKGPSGDKTLSLSKAIHLLKPDADAKTETKNAEKQAKDDLKQAGA
jgi:hypothetical protein